ncbi:MAG TPA: Hsp20/alpha crystallin family protein [Verrucomicrobiae bacterium]|jgi:HSP20 family protein
MNLLRWQRPGLTAWTLSDEIDRLFGAPLGELTPASRLLNGSAPTLDIFEDKDNFIVKAELPGMKKEDIDVSLHDGTLSISGERKSEAKWDGAEVYRAERFFGRFQRTVALPAPVAAGKIKGQYKDGILTVTLPKAEEAKPKHIEVQVN